MHSTLSALVFSLLVVTDSQGADVCEPPSPAPEFLECDGGRPVGGGQPRKSLSYLQMAGELPVAPVLPLVPGPDTSMCMSWEPTIAVDPNAPATIAVAQFLTILVSFDGGNTFPATVTAPGTNPGGDPSLAFDSQGRLFLTYLCSPGAGRDVCISGYTCNAGTASCALLPGAWPVNIAAQAGVGGNNADKEWIAADTFVGSANTDRLHVAWIRLDTNPWSTWVSFSDDGQNWSAAQQLSAADEGNAWPVHLAVGTDGAVYVAWHSQPGVLDPAGGDVPDGVTGQVVLRRSDDGGTVWQPRVFPYGPGQSDMTFNVQHEANGVIPGATMWLTGSLQPWILPDPFNASRVFVVANDDPDNNIDAGGAADVFIVTSNDQATMWGAPLRVDHGPAGTFQIMPTAAINPVNGAIGVTYYDNRALADADNDTVFELDLLATFSTDGGATWSAEVDINDGTINPAQANGCRFCGSDAVTNQPCGTPACPGPSTVRIGEYNGVAFGECTLHAVWADDSAPTCGGDFDTFYDRDPQLGGDFSDPNVNCPADVDVGCNDPTGPASTGSATATDVCDLDPAITFEDDVLPGNCPPGDVRQTIERTWTATDAAGNAASCEQTISVVDADPPDVFPPAPLALECNAPGGVPASDPQIVAWLGSASAVDECGPASVSDDAPALFEAGCPPGGQDTTVTFTGTDECGNSASDTSTVTVTDTTAPAVNCAVQVASLWPPNHKFVNVGFTFQATDICDTQPLSIAIGVTSDEHPSDAQGAGGSKHCPDAIVGANGTVQLRSERSGGADGRVYRITVTATDSCGNPGVCSADVVVPKSQGNDGGAVDSGQLYDATVCGKAAAAPPSPESKQSQGAPRKQRVRLAH
jgi:hypothetical protein